jgi:hypothetical protein
VSTAWTNVGLGGWLGGRLGRQLTSRLTPPRFPTPAYSCECRVLKSAHNTRLDGQIMLGGDTRKRRMMPPIEKPMS